MQDPAAGETSHLPTAANLKTALMQSTDQKGPGANLAAPCQYAANPFHATAFA